jgi:hypothetical protein
MIILKKNKCQKLNLFGCFQLCMSEKLTKNAYIRNLIYF